jgi:membrane protein required for colicin V production
MSAIDYLIAALLAVTLVLGLVRGFIREAIGLLGWLCGLWLAWRYAHLLTPMLGGEIANEPLRTWVARAAILLTVLLVAWMLAAVVSYFVHSSGLSESLDRIFGGLFGILRGVVLVALFALASQKVRLDEMSWWKQSRLLPYAAMISGWIVQFAETGEPKFSAANHFKCESSGATAPSERACSEHAFLLSVLT